MDFIVQFAQPLRDVRYLCTGRIYTHDYRSSDLILGDFKRDWVKDDDSSAQLPSVSDGGAEPLADQGIGDTLDADTRLPAVIKSKAVAAVIIAALMHQPPDGPVLLVGQPGNVLHRSTSRRFCRVCSCWRIATSAFRFTCCSLRKSFWMGLYYSYSAVYSCLSLACSCSHAWAGILPSGERCLSSLRRVMWNVRNSPSCSLSKFSLLPFHLIPFHSS